MAALFAMEKNLKSGMHWLTQVWSIHITKSRVVAFRRRKEGPGRLGVLNSDTKCFLRCKQGTEESEE